MKLPQTAFQDLRYGTRMLYRNPSLTIVLVLALGVGIGTNTAAFTAYKAFIGRRFDGRDPGKMVNLGLIFSQQSGRFTSDFSYPDYETYRDQLHSLSGVIARGEDERVTLSRPGDAPNQQGSLTGSLIGRLVRSSRTTTSAEFADVALVSENYFSVLGVEALRGRTFDVMDSAELTASPSVLISENYWRRRFGGEASILGKTVRLNGIDFVVIGITPHDFVGTGMAAPNFWIPLRNAPLLHEGNHWLRDREHACCRMFGRLAPGIGIKQAQAEMATLTGQLSALHDRHPEFAKSSIAVVWPGSPFPFPLDRNNGLKYAVSLIMIAAAMVLVIACANVASLQLASAVSRQNELGIRLSLGASRLRLIRQLLTESAALGLLAGIVGLLSSWVLLKVLAIAAAEAFPAQNGTLIFHVTPDLEILAYVFAISQVAGILFGLAPALESSRAALFVALKAGSGTSSVRGGRLRNIFIGTQVAVSLTLMITGTMLIRSSNHLLKREPGYDVKHVVSLNLRFPEGPKYTTDRKVALIHDLRDQLANLPGVSAITSGQAPDGSGGQTAAVSINGKESPAPNARIFIAYTYVRANYFETLSIPLVLGRGFSSQSSQPESSVILNESAARRLWPGQNPIGRMLRLSTGGLRDSKKEVLPDGPTYEVIGIVRDTLSYSLDGQNYGQIFVPLPEDRLQDYPILIRTKADPVQLTGTAGVVISSIDPELVATCDTLEEMLLQTPAFTLASFAAAIASVVGLLGLLLASMGLYGTVSYIVALRTRDVGVHMALGAQKRDILGLMLRESLWPVLSGLPVGMFLAVGACYLVRGLLYGLRIIDFISYLGVSVLFLAIAMLAAYMPSRRAMYVDPIVALRYE